MKRLTPAELLAVRNSPARIAERRRKQAAKDARYAAKLRQKFGVTAT